jgi:putative flippase GtrA
VTREVARQAVRFGAVGLLNTVVGFSVILLCMSVFRMNDFVANALGYAVGLTVSFAANRYWTFADRGRWGRSAFRFIVVFIVAYLVNLVALLIVRDGLGADSRLAQAAGVVAYAVVFFIGSRSFAFTDPAAK